MTVLIIGHEGMLARALLPALQQLGLPAVSLGRPAVDLTRPATLVAAFTTYQPTVVINTAAYTAVDQAEQEPGAAFAVNRDGVGMLAMRCALENIPLLHVSTDYVFDGKATTPYQEDACPGPLQIYGQSKWAGEQAVRALHRQHLILRTAWVYAATGANFLTTMLAFARTQRVLKVVDDQVGCPTWSRDLATVLASLAQRCALAPASVPWGTYHVCGAGATSWYGFAQAILAGAQAFAPLRAQTVLPMPTSALGRPARRPAYAALDCTRLQTAFGLTTAPWQESVSRCLQEAVRCSSTSIDRS